MEVVGGKRVLKCVYFFALGQSKGKWRRACFRSPMGLAWQRAQEHGDVWGWTQTDVGKLTAPWWWGSLIQGLASDLPHWAGIM